MDTKIVWTIVIISVIVIGGIVYYYYNKQDAKAKEVKHNEKEEPMNEQGYDTVTPPELDMAGILVD